jgi:hypothetical protein
MEIYFSIVQGKVLTPNDYLFDPAVDLQAVDVNDGAEIIELVMPGGHGRFAHAPSGCSPSSMLR